MVRKCIVAILVCSLFLCLYIKRPVLPATKIELPHSVSPTLLRKHVEVISNEMSPRSWRHPNVLDQVANYIDSHFISMNISTQLQPFNVEGNQYVNVIGRINPELNTPAIIIGAHYDSYGKLPGADDNASGVAGLIELARLLSHCTQISQCTLKVPIHLVAYTLEEPPFFRTPKMGSAVHAKSLRDDNIPIRLMISLEMIGYFDTNKRSQGYPNPLLKTLYPDTGDFITVIGDFSFSSPTAAIKRAFRSVTDLPIRSVNAPSFIPGIDFSDHLNYWNNDFEAVMISDTSFYRNNRYHTDADTADTLDYSRMAQVVEGVYGYLKSIEE